MYSIHLEKEYFHFCSAHFVIFDREKREELHGHNYYVSMELEGDALQAGKLVDISELKRIIRAICDRLDHKLLLPDSNPHLELNLSEGMIYVKYAETNFSFPTSDVLILKMNNTTMENLANYILSESIGAYPKLKDMKWVSLTVKETKGQSGSFKQSFKE